MRNLKTEVKKSVIAANLFWQADFIFPTNNFSEKHKQTHFEIISTKFILFIFFFATENRFLYQQSNQTPINANTQLQEKCQNIILHLLNKVPFCTSCSLINQRRNRISETTANLTGAIKMIRVLKISKHRKLKFQFPVRVSSDHIFDAALLLWCHILPRDFLFWSFTYIYHTEWVKFVEIVISVFLLGLNIKSMFSFFVTNGKKINGLNTSLLF